MKPKIITEVRMKEPKPDPPSSYNSLHLEQFPELRFRKREGTIHVTG